MSGQFCFFSFPGFLKRLFQLLVDSPVSKNDLLFKAIHLFSFSMWYQSKNKKKKSKKYQPPDWGAIIDETRREIEISPFFEKFINKLPVDERISIICLGLGSITNSRSARHQLALLEAILMKNENFSLENLFDPAFTEDDLLILNQKFQNVAKQEFQGFQDDNSHRLLYLPHVPLWLLDDCIYKCRERLSNLIIIGNDMRTILETQNSIGNEKNHLEQNNFYYFRERRTPVIEYHPQ